MQAPAGPVPEWQRRPPGPAGRRHAVRLPPGRAVHAVAGAV